MHWFIASLNHRFIDSSIHWIIDSLIHWFIHSLIHWFIDSLAHWFIDAVLVHSLSCARILSCHFIGISTTISTFVDAPHNFNRSGLLHLKSVPIGHWFLIVISYFRNFRPGAGRALSGLGINIILCVYTYYIHTHIIHTYILYIYILLLYIYMYTEASSHIQSLSREENTAASPWKAALPRCDDATRPRGTPHRGARWKGSPLQVLERKLRDVVGRWRFNYPLVI